MRRSASSITYSRVEEGEVGLGEGEFGHDAVNRSRDEGRATEKRWWYVLV